MKCLESVNMTEAKQPSVDAIVLERAVAVQMIVPEAVCTFQEYIDTVFQPFNKQFNSVIDVLKNISFTVKFLSYWGPLFIT